MLQAHKSTEPQNVSSGPKAFKFLKSVQFQVTQVEDACGSFTSCQQCSSKRLRCYMQALKCTPPPKPEMGAATFIACWVLSPGVVLSPRRVVSMETMFSLPSASFCFFYRGSDVVALPLHIQSSTQILTKRVAVIQIPVYRLLLHLCFNDQSSS